MLYILAWIVGTICGVFIMCLVQLSSKQEQDTFMLEMENEDLKIVNAELQRELNEMPEVSKDYGFICVDFDGTLCEECWPEIGKKKNHVFDWIFKQKTQHNSKIILFTCRADDRLDNAIEWCRQHGLEFDSINSNPFSQFAHLGQGNKPYADIYLDDKAYRC